MTCPPIHPSEIRLIAVRLDEYMRNGSKAFSPAITLWLLLGECCDTEACLNSLLITSNVVIQAGMSSFTPVCAHNKRTNEKVASSDVWTLNTDTF